MRKLRARLRLIRNPLLLRKQRRRRKRNPLKADSGWDSQLEPGERIILPNTLGALDRRVSSFRLIQSIGIIDTPLSECRWAHPMNLVLEWPSLAAKAACSGIVAIALKPKEVTSFRFSVRLRNSGVTPAPGLTWYYWDLRRGQAGVPQRFALWCVRNWNRTFGVTPIRFKTLVRSPTLLLAHSMGKLYNRNKPLPGKDLPIQTKFPRPTWEAYRAAPVQPERPAATAGFARGFLL